MRRDQRDRMTETFVAVHDALQRAAVPMYQVVMDKVPTLPRPGYLPETPPQTVREYQSALGKLDKLGVLRVN